MPPLTAKVPGSGAGTLSYTVPGDGLDIETVYAVIDASGAGADVTAEITIQDQAGVVIARKQQTTKIPAGASGSATWALRLADDGSTAAAGVVIGQAFGVSGWRSGCWYTSQFLSGSSTQQVVDGALVLWPIWVPGATVQAIGWIQDAFVLNGNIRFACYRDNGFGYPGVLQFDSGQQGVGAGNGKKTRVLSSVMPAGLYWLGMCGQGASAGYRAPLTGAQVAASDSTFANVDTFTGFTNYLATGILGAFPDPFPAGNAPATGGAASIFLWLQVA